MSDPSTIAAIATAPGRAALAIVRVSGPEALAVADRLGLPASEPRHLRHATIAHPESGDPLDDVVAVRFRGPSSYTGEDMLEITCHGGSLVPQLVLAAVCACGARPAERGEFTRRAFLNGKMDLSQAEAVLDLIEARSPAMHRAALFQLERGLSRRISELREGLLDLQGLLAYDIDFPDEDEGPVAPERVDGTAGSLLRQLRRMLELAPEGELLRDGALTVIAGRPNVGKSSVFNSLLGFSRAIVTEEPGTTRDAIEALVSFEGYPFRVVDTAGLRDAEGRVERLGIEVARSYLRGADMVLLCAEAGRELGDDERGFVKELAASGTPVTMVRTKADLPAAGVDDAPGGGDGGDGVRVSAVTGEGLPELRARLLDAMFGGLREEEETPVVTRARQLACLRRALQAVEAFTHARERGLPAEVAGTHLQDATLALEDLLGVVTDEEILERVFSSFCVGK